MRPWQIFHVGLPDDNDGIFPVARNMEEDEGYEWVRRSLTAALIWGAALSAQTAVAQQAFGFPQDEIPTPPPPFVDEDYPAPITVWPQPWRLAQPQHQDEIPQTRVEEEYKLPYIVWSQWATPSKIVDEEFVVAPTVTVVEEDYSLPQQTWQSLYLAPRPVDDEIVPVAVTPLNVEEEYLPPRAVWSDTLLATKLYHQEEWVPQPVVVPLNVDDDRLPKRPILWPWFITRPIWLFEQQDNVPRVIVPCPPRPLIKTCPTTTDNIAWTTDTILKMTDGSCEGRAPTETPDDAVQMVTKGLFLWVEARFAGVESGPGSPIIDPFCAPEQAAQANNALREWEDLSDNQNDMIEYIGSSQITELKLDPTWTLPDGQPRAVTGAGFLNPASGAFFNSPLLRSPPLEPVYPAAFTLACVVTPQGPPAPFFPHNSNAALTVGVAEQDFWNGINYRAFNNGTGPASAWNIQWPDFNTKLTVYATDSVPINRGQTYRVFGSANPNGTLDLWVDGVKKASVPIGAPGGTDAFVDSIFPGLVEFINLQNAAPGRRIEIGRGNSYIAFRFAAMWLRKLSDAEILQVDAYMKIACGIP